MKSGYWTREFIAGLFHLITPYWNSEEKEIGTALSCSYHYPHNCRRIYDAAFKRMVQFFFTALCRIMTATRSTADCSVSRDLPSPISPLRSTATTCSSAWRSAGGNG